MTISKMPILWSYLLRSFLRVFLLCVSAFISVLLVMRFEEIARFATSGAPQLKILLFTLYQIPSILPIAIPISCLIAAILLLQRMSSTHELTALRTAGLGLKEILTPLFLVGVGLSIVNLTIASEIAPRCRALSKELICEIAALNPLFLLQKESLIKLKNAYIDIKALKAGKYAEDMLFVVKNSSGDRLGLMSAKELALEGELLKGHHVTFISSVDPKKPGGFDHLVIENQQEMDTEAANLGQFIQTVDWAGNYDYMPMRMILANEKVKKSHSRHALAIGRGAQYEISRRLSIALAAFTFTMIGVAFGLRINRNRSKKGLLWAIGLAAAFMVCFVAAKSLRHSPMLSTAIFLLPHPVICLLSLRFLKAVKEGVE